MQSIGFQSRRKDKNRPDSFNSSACAHTTIHFASTSRPLRCHARLNRSWGGLSPWFGQEHPEGKLDELAVRFDRRLEGQVNGNSELPGHVLAIVEPKTITAPIVAKTVTIKGAVTGNVTAREQGAIQKRGSLAGNVALVVIRVFAEP